MTTRSTERVDFLANVLITAVEGGCMFWAEMESYKWEDDTAGTTVSASVRVRSEIDPGVWHEVGINDIARGIGKIVRKEVEVGSHIREWIVEDNSENDASNIDADAADCIVQIALFGELIFA